MKRPMINATLFNVGTENDEYQELCQQMVEELAADEMDVSLDAKLGMLEDHVLNIFTDFDDDTLQNMYDNLMDSKNDEEMVVDQEDIENLLKEKN